MSSLRKLYYLAKLRKRAWADRETLLRSQNERIAKIVMHAYKTVPYYRKAYKELGLERNPITSMKELERLPIIGKKEIQSDPEAFISETINKSKLMEMHTSGSTGKPLTIYYGEVDDDYSKVNNLRSFIEVGYKYGDNFITISDPDWVEGRYNGKTGISLQKRLNLFYPIDVNMRLTSGEIVDEIKEIGKCDILYGYPTNILLVAQEIQRRKEKSIMPRIVVSNGETLDDLTRSYIEETFETRMFNFYTTEESKRIAWECEQHNGMHLDVESVALELLKDGKQVPDGELGSVTITNLFNYTMPLVRYRQGDVARKEKKPCSCGRGAPLLGSLEGRIDSFIVNAEGEMFSPQVFWSIFRHYRSVSQFLISQTCANEISVNIQLADKRERRDLPEILGKIRNVVGDRTNTILYIGEIQATGKRKAVHSSLEKPVFQ
ncbi:MAG: phenylacetate--CoA ligase family protein [Proteobacteria bacterium]|nr:phenylacetate--CoA ligase family protein [Pseudomonadota bacterium]